jgi:hypothetical protein
VIPEAPTLVRRWQLVRLSHGPRELGKQFVRELAELLQRVRPTLRFPRAWVGVELADGRRRRLPLQAPEGLGADALPRLLQEWSDGTSGAWVGHIHGIQAEGQLLALAPRDPDSPACLGWVPERTIDPLAAGRTGEPSMAKSAQAEAILVRLADLEGNGHLHLELRLQGESLLTGRSGIWNRPRLARLLDRLGQGHDLLLFSGTLLAPPPSGEAWPLRESRGALHLLPEGPDRRITLVLEVAADSPMSRTSLQAQVRQSCLELGDELTRTVATLLPDGPFSLPATLTLPGLREHPSLANLLDHTQDHPLDLTGEKPP